MCEYAYVEVTGQHLKLSSLTTLFLKQGLSLHMESTDLDLARLSASQPRYPQPQGASPAPSRTRGMCFLYESWLFI